VCQPNLNIKAYFEANHRTEVSTCENPNSVPASENIGLRPVWRNATKFDTNTNAKTRNAIFS